MAYCGVCGNDDDTCDYCAGPGACEACGTELDRDCFGNDRCEECDGPCPGCSDGGPDDVVTDDEPTDGDWITADYRTFYEVNGRGVVRARNLPDGSPDWAPAMRAQMDKDRFWPNVWVEEERGGAHLIEWPPEPIEPLKEAAARLGALAADDYFREFEISPYDDGRRSVGDWDSAAWDAAWAELRRTGATHADYDRCLSIFSERFWAE